MINDVGDLVGWGFVEGFVVVEYVWLGVVVGVDIIM